MKMRVFCVVVNRRHKVAQSEKRKEKKGEGKRNEYGKSSVELTRVASC